MAQQTKERRRQTGCTHYHCRSYIMDQAINNIIIIPIMKIMMRRQQTRKSQRQQHFSNLASIPLKFFFAALTAVPSRALARSLRSHSPALSLRYVPDCMSTCQI